MHRPYRCVLLFGTPGAGKGTQGKRLGMTEGYLHIATGDIFRALDKTSEAGKEFKRYSSRGELVPDELTVRIWEEHLDDLIARGRFVPDRDILVLDGIPRSLPQARILDAHIEPLAILHLVVTDMDTLIERMAGRSEQEGRHDDVNEDIVRRRFEVYKAATMPVLEHYPPELIHEINAVGTVDEVTWRIRAALARLEQDGDPRSWSKHDQAG